MKKNLLLVFLFMFALSSAVFAGDPKKESEKPTTSNPKENKMSEEEISRLTRHAETDNLSASNLSNNEKNNLKPPQEIYVTSNRHHHGYYYGGAGLILLIILIVVLV
jgi:hypothetical protein